MSLILRKSSKRRLKTKTLNTSKLIINIGKAAFTGWFDWIIQNQSACESPNQININLIFQQAQGILFWIPHTHKSRSYKPLLSSWFCAWQMRISRIIIHIQRYHHQGLLLLIWMFWFEMFRFWSFNFIFKSFGWEIYPRIVPVLCWSTSFKAYSTETITNKKKELNFISF